LQRDHKADVRGVSGRRLKAGGSQDWLPHCAAKSEN